MALKRLQSFTQECKRVLRVTRKPTGKELQNIIKITGVGILVVGFIGFLIYLFSQLLLRVIDSMIL